MARVFTGSSGSVSTIGARPPIATDTGKVRAVFGPAGTRRLQ